MIVLDQRRESDYLIAHTVTYQLEHGAGHADDRGPHVTTLYKWVKQIAPEKKTKQKQT